MMDKFMQQLGIVSIERRPEACLGCGFEHSCSTHGCAVIKTASEQLKAYRVTSHTPQECAAAFEELAAYRAAEQDGTLRRLPFVAMVEQSMQDGKMKPEKDQRFNGWYGAVYHSPRWGCPLIDICGTPYNSEQATKRVAALKEQEAANAR